MAQKSRYGMIVMLFFMVFFTHVSTSLVYMTGSSGVRLGGGTGGSHSFNRHMDWMLWDMGHGFSAKMRADDVAKLAAGVPPEDERLYEYRLVRTKKAKLPFCLVCGKWRGRENIIYTIRYRNGDWLYDMRTDHGEPAAWNIKTGEVILSERAPDAEKAFKHAEGDPALVRIGANYDESHIISRKDIEALFVKPLNHIKDSCIEMHAAFIFLYILLLLAAGIQFIYLLIKGA